MKRNSFGKSTHRNEVDSTENAAMQSILKNDYEVFTTDTKISPALASYTALEDVKWNISCVVLGDGEQGRLDENGDCCHM